MGGDSATTPASACSIEEVRLGELVEVCGEGVEVAFMASSI